MVLSDFFSNFAPKYIRVLILDEKSYCICGLYPRGGLSAVIVCMIVTKVLSLIPGSKYVIG